ncbi:MAG: PqqD family peptide modification chaperone [Clostridiales bacterium]|nr:PqqD family peptide modification chaperone [Clostridiales bacterium]
MKPDSCWILQEIAGVPYILPYGQAAACLRRSLRVNEPCAFLWEQLQADPSREELLDAFAAHYQATEEELPQLAADLDDFLAQLTAYGILRPKRCADISSCAAPSGEDPAAALPENCHVPAYEKPAAAGKQPTPRSASGRQPADGSPADTREHFLRIGGLTLRILGPDSAMPPEFAPFACAPNDPADQTIEILPPPGPAKRVPDENAFPDTAQAPHRTCSILIFHPQLVVQDCEAEYFLHFPQAPQIFAARLKKDGTAARIFCDLPLNEPSVADLFHTIRIIYLYFAQKKGVFALHSASILYQGKAWLFSGQSGTGKSTHAQLWNRLFETPILNGDLNLLTIRDGEPVVRGLPWCGTSGISTAEDYPLGGVILLKQARHNLCLKPGADRQQLLLAQRFISPSWTSDQLLCNLRFAGELSALAPVRILSCTKEDAAAVYLKDMIDSGTL